MIRLRERTFFAFGFVFFEAAFLGRWGALRVDLMARS
jgi:hypothetical protein